MTKEELVDAIIHNDYTTQKDLAVILNDTQQNVSRALKKYDLGELFAEHKSQKKKEQTNPALEKYLERQREDGAILWLMLLEQGGFLHPDDQYKLLCENPNGATYIGAREGIKQEVEEIINLYVASNTPWDEIPEEHQNWISACLYRVKMIFLSKKERK